MENQYILLYLYGLNKSEQENFPETLNFYHLNIKK